MFEWMIYMFQFSAWASDRKSPSVSNVWRLADVGGWLIEVANYKSKGYLPRSQDPFTRCSAYFSQNNAVLGDSWNQAVLKKVRNIIVSFAFEVLCTITAGICCQGSLYERLEKCLHTFSGSEKKKNWKKKERKEKKSLWKNKQKKNAQRGWGGFRYNYSFLKKSCGKIIIIG